MYYVIYATVEWGSKWDTDQTVSPKIEQNSLRRNEISG